MLSTLDRAEITILGFSIRFAEGFEWTMRVSYFDTYDRNHYDPVLLLNTHRAFYGEIK
jgi:hypothetical protein